ncbi:hypothetical protein ACJX0J_001070, partial (mitochondrion) [Zea mays]
KCVSQGMMGLEHLNPNTSIMIDIDLKGLAESRKALGERKTLFSAHIPFLDIISEVVDATERGIVQVLSLFSFGDLIFENSHRGLRFIDSEDELLIKRYLFSFPYH